MRILVAGKLALAIGLVLAAPGAGRAGARLEGAARLVPGERAWYRVALAGDPSEAVCGVALEVDVPPGFLALGTHPSLGARDAASGRLSFVALERLAAGEERVFDFQLQAPALPASGVLCVSASYRRCDDPPSVALVREPTCRTLLVVVPEGTDPAPAPVPAAVEAQLSKRRAAARLEIPCLERQPLLDGAVSAGEYLGALVQVATRQGSSPPERLTAYAYHDVDFLYVAFDVDDPGYDAEDAVHLLVDVDDDGADPGAPDRQYEVLRGGPARMLAGIGSNLDGQLWQVGAGSISQIDRKERPGGWSAELAIPFTGVSSDDLALTGQGEDVGLAFLGYSTGAGAPWAELPAGALLDDASTWAGATLAGCPPQPAFTASPGCALADIAFAATAGNAPTSWDWDFGDGTVLAGAGPAVTHRYLAGGVYTVKLSACNVFGCGSTSRPLEVFALPAAVLAASPAIGCARPDLATSLALDASGSAPGSGATIAYFAWSTTLAGPLAGSGPGETLTVPAGTSGTGTVTVEVHDSNGCTASASQAIEVRPAPSADFALQPPRVCADDASPTSVAIAAAASGPTLGPDAYRFSDSRGFILAGSGPTRTLRVPPGFAGSVDVVLEIADDAGCAASGRRTLAVLPGPAPRVLPLASTLCAGGDRPLILRLDAGGSAAGSGGAAIAAYHWSATPEAAVRARGSQAELTIAPDYAGSGRAKVVVEDADGCRREASAEYRVLAPPAVSAATAGPALAGAAQSFTASSPDPDASFAWTFSDGSAADGGTVTHAFAAPGSARATVRATGKSSCSAEATLALDIAPGAPRLRFSQSVSPASVRPGGEVEFTILVGADGGSLREAIIEDRLPAGFAYRPGTILRDGAPMPEPIGDDRLRLAAFDLAAGVTTIVRYRARVGDDVPAGDYDNVAELAARDARGEPVYGSPRIATVRVEGAPVAEPPADLVLSLSAAALAPPARPGGEITWTLAWRNAGPGVARAAFIDGDYDDSRLTLATPPSGAQAGAGGFHLALGDLMPGDAGSIAYTATVRDGIEGEVATRGRIASAGADARPEDNLARAAVEVIGAPAGLAVTASRGPAPCAAASAAPGSGWLDLAGGECRPAAVRLVDRSFRTETGLLAVLGMEAAGRALERRAKEKGDRASAELGVELLRTAQADRETLAVLSGMGVGLGFAPGVGGDAGLAKLLAGYAAQAGLDAVPEGLLPVWLELGGGDPVFVEPIAPASRYRVGWDPSRHDPVLDAAALGQALLADVRSVEAGLASGTSRSRFLARVELHAATLKVEFVARELEESREVAAWRPALDAAGGPREIARIRGERGTRGDAALLLGLAAYRRLLGSAAGEALGADGVPLAPLAAEHASRTLVAELGRDLAAGESDSLGLWYATAARCALAAIEPDARTASPAAARASAEVLDVVVAGDRDSPLARASLQVAAAASGGMDAAALSERFRRLVARFHDPRHRLFRSRAEDGGERMGEPALDVFVLTDLDVGSLLLALAATVEQGAPPERDQAGELLEEASRRLLLETGLQGRQQRTVASASGEWIEPAPQVSRAVRIAIPRPVSVPGALQEGEEATIAVRVENPIPGSVAELAAIETEPGPGLAYVAGSARLDGTASADPVAARSLVFPLGELVSGTPRELSYRVKVEAGAGSGSLSVAGKATGRARPGPDGARIESAPFSVEVPVEVLGAIAGRVVLDLDGDGAPGASEAGVAGVAVELDAAQWATTDAAGVYRIGGLGPGEYTARIALASLPPAHGPVGRSEARVRIAGSETAGADFALAITEMVTGLVYRDEDGDRRRGPGEPVVAGVAVEIEAGTSSITDAQGRYVIRGVTPGTHRLRIARKQPYVGDAGDLGILPAPLELPTTGPATAAATSAAKAP